MNMDDEYIRCVARRTRAREDAYIKHKHHQLIQQGRFKPPRNRHNHNFSGLGDAPQIQTGDGQVKDSEKNEEAGSKHASKQKRKGPQGHGDASNQLVIEVDQIIGKAQNETSHSNIGSKPKRARYEGIDNSDYSDYLTSKHENNTPNNDSTIHSEKSNLRSNESNGSSNFKNVPAEVNTKIVLVDYSSDSSSSAEENDSNNSFSSSDPQYEDSDDAIYGGDSGSSDKDTSCSSTKAGSERKFKKSLGKVSIDAEEEETFNAPLVADRVTDKQDQANPFLSVNNHILPLKFNFEDEVDLQDKTYFDNMVDDLFTNMKVAKTCDKIGSNGIEIEDVQVKGNDKIEADGSNIVSKPKGRQHKGKISTVPFNPRTRGKGVSNSRLTSQAKGPATQNNPLVHSESSDSESSISSKDCGTNCESEEHGRPDLGSKNAEFDVKKQKIKSKGNTDTSGSSTKAGSKRKFKKSLAKLGIDAEEEETLNAPLVADRVTNKQNQANPFLRVNNHILPLKFSFEDEVHLQDKTESDNMVEDLFTEMAFAETCDKIVSNKIEIEDVQVTGNDKIEVGGSNLVSKPKGRQHEGKIPTVSFYPRTSDEGESNSRLTSQAKGPATQNNPLLVHIESSDSSDSESSISSKDSVIVVGTNCESEEHGGPDLGSKNAKSEAKKQKIKSKGKHDDSNIFKDIVDSILDEGSIDEQNEANPLSTADTHVLPLKFMFEDEVEPPEKTEFENMVADLFDEMTFGERVDNVGSFANIPSEETKNPNVLKKKLTRSELCRNDMHQVVLDEEIGRVCCYCHLVVTEIRYVMPPFKSSESTMSEGEDFLYKKENPMFDGLQFANPKDYSSQDWRYKQSNMNGTVWDTVPGIRDQIYPHQAEGLEFIWKNLEGTIHLNELKGNNSNGFGGCIISHAPGTGKTRLAIVFIETYLKIFPKCRPVIIAPASMLLTWEEEFKKWKVDFPFHNLNNSDLSGKENELPSSLLHSSLNLTAKERTRLVKLYSWGKGPSILGVSYNLYEKLARGESFVGTTGEKSKLRKAVESTKKSEWGELLLNLPGLVILDEGHTPRNEKSGIWNILTKLLTKKRIILSGTPFQNNFGELFNTLHIVRPDIVNSLAKNKTFVEAKRKYRRINSGQGKNMALSKGSAEIWDAPIKMLKEVIAPFVHVYKGSILQQSLPGLMNSVIILNPHLFQKQIMDKIELQNTFEDERKVALVSTHPSLIDRCTLSSKEKSTIPIDELKRYALNPNMGVKTRFIAELVNLSLSLNEKVLVFSQYVDPLGFINDQLKELFNWNEGIEVLQMHGKMDQKQRQRIMEDFNNPNSNAKVLLASIKCCSEGINLVGASRVVLLDVTWNPSVERQAISRAYRLGQKKVVHSYHLIMGGTAEGKKLSRQAEKGLLSERMFSLNNKEKYNSDDHNKQQNDLGLNDKVLEAFCENNNLKGMFEKIIYQPHEAELIENFS